MAKESAERYNLELEGTVVVDRPAQELYHAWRNVENLPRFISHLKKVRWTDENRSHWVMKASQETLIEWAAEIVEEREGEFIAWHSLKGAGVAHIGSVFLQEKPGEGTEVRVKLEYHPPADVVGKMILQLFGDAPQKRFEEDLSCFKELAEAQELNTAKRTPGDEDEVVEASQESFPASDAPSWICERTGGAEDKKQG